MELKPLYQFILRAKKRMSPMWLLSDVESELSLDSLLAKFSKTPTDSLAIFSFNFPAISEAAKTPFQLIGREILPDKPDTLLPPSRAPPAIA
jgi:hypothetical protein